MTPVEVQEKIEGGAEAVINATRRDGRGAGRPVNGRLLENSAATLTDSFWPN